MPSDMLSKWQKKTTEILVLSIHVTYGSADIIILNSYLCLVQ